MKKLLFFLSVIAVLFSCSSDDEPECVNGKIRGKGNYDGCYLQLDNGITIAIECDDLDSYKVGDCYEPID